MPWKGFDGIKTWPNLRISGIEVSGKVVIEMSNLSQNLQAGETIRAVQRHCRPVQVEAKTAQINP
jgi:hypothetical protein